DEIRAAAQERLGRSPCLWQLEVGKELIERKNDIISTAATGDGKTLTFWLPLLFNESGVLLIVTALNLLADQNVQELARYQIPAIAINGNDKSAAIYKDIENLKYKVVIVNPEILMMDDGGFEALLKKSAFTTRLMGVDIDEGHCVSQWGGFRPEYREIGRLRHLLPQSIPFYVTSATLPPPIITDIRQTLNLRPSHTKIFLRSNDRTNVHIVVREMKYAQSGFQDLAFLVQNWTPEKSPPKFLVFFDSMREAELATLYLRSLLPPEHREKVKWFHSVMTPDYRNEETEALASDENWGFCTTDSFGMGLDMRDVRIVAQWKANKASTIKICQRAGRGARDLSLTATAIIFVEPSLFDKEDKAAKPPNASKRKETPASSLPDRSAKRRRSADGAAVAGEGPANIEGNRYRKNDKDAKPTQKKRGKGKGDNADIEPALSDLINAPTRGIKCRRKIWTIFFGNDQLRTLSSLHCHHHSRR
ncbi:P-loop containing nucleoside triphosphate hydrolase protein, partial [Auriscalpium vulgare]